MDSSNKNNPSFAVLTCSLLLPLFSYSLPSLTAVWPPRWLNGSVTSESSSTSRWSALHDRLSARLSLGWFRLALVHVKFICCIISTVWLGFIDANMAGLNFYIDIRSIWFMHQMLCICCPAYLVNSRRKELQNTESSQNVVVLGSRLSCFMQQCEAS